MAGQFATRKRRRKSTGFVIPIMMIVVALLVMAMVAGYYVLDGATPSTQLQEQPGSSAPGTTPTTQPTQPSVVKLNTATIGATGDLLLHDRVISSGYNSADGTYNYDNFFTYFAAYASKVDYAVANLEVTLCGTDNGYKYAGYPCFNSPDAIVDAAKKAGFDMLLTANNHSFDTRSTGFFRTQQVVADRGLDHIGTRENVSDKTYVIKEINGIKIGMICYTYNTGVAEDGSVSLNGIPLTAQASALINSYTYEDLDSFYGKLSGEVAAMRTEGAEAIMLYIHWGDEYHIEANSTQKEMSQALCDMGIEVIVGNHAHVPQPVELLTNSKDESKKTLCLYSTGNAISNIRRGPSYPEESEDGMLFTVTFAKYSDGTVIVESADILPTWVDRYDVNGKYQYRILTLENSKRDQWQTDMSLSDAILLECEASYDRTMAIVGEGLEESNAYFTENQALIEKNLGIG